MFVLFPWSKKSAGSFFPMKKKLAIVDHSDLQQTLITSSRTPIAPTVFSFSKVSSACSKQTRSSSLFLIHLLSYRSLLYPLCGYTFALLPFFEMANVRNSAQTPGIPRFSPTASLHERLVCCGADEVSSR